MRFTDSLRRRAMLRSGRMIEIANQDELEERLGYRFREPGLLERTLAMSDDSRPEPG